MGGFGEDESGMWVCELEDGVRQMELGRGFEADGTNSVECV